MREQIPKSNTNGVYPSECVEKWLNWLDMKHLHPTEQMMRIDTRMQLADDF